MRSCSTAPTHSHRCFAAATLLLFGALAPTVATAQGFTFTKVADTETPVEGIALSSFHDIALDQGNVAFIGYGENRFRLFIHTGIGQIERPAEAVETSHNVAAWIPAS